MPSERIILLLEKKEKGSCNSSELQELENWYVSFAPLESKIEHSLEERTAETALLKSSIYSSIRSRLDVNDGSIVNEDSIAEPVPLFRQWWKRSFAACAVLLLIAGVVFYQNPVLLSPGTIAVSTKANETNKVLLPDSSVVWLKPGSQLRYSPNLNSGSLREVFLEGEGLFEISHNASRPFVVHVNSLDIKVLGTVFNVRAHRKDQTVETTLFEGSVRIEKNDGAAERITLTPNQQAVYSKKSQQIKISSMALAAAIAKVDMPVSSVPMIFDENSFTELLYSIEKKFDVTVYIHDRSRQSCLFTGDFEKESLIEILDLLKINYGIEYRLYGKEVFIEGAICKK